jgi:type II secretory pathway component PulK
MATVKPEDRQYLIDVWTELLVSKGMDEERAEEFATEVTDQAIAQQQS